MTETKIMTTPIMTTEIVITTINNGSCVEYQKPSALNQSHRCTHSEKRCVQIGLHPRKVLYDPQKTFKNGKGGHRKPVMVSNF